MILTFLDFLKQKLLVPNDVLLIDHLLFDVKGKIIVFSIFLYPFVIYQLPGTNPFLLETKYLRK